MADEAQEILETLRSLVPGQRHLTRRQVLMFLGGRKALAQVGGAKRLTQLLNHPKYGPMLREAHDWWGWPGIVLTVVALLSRAEALETAFVAIGEPRLVKCPHQDHKGTYWFLALRTGRTPEGCPQHARQLAVAKWSPNRKPRRKTQPKKH